ncbi:MAG TPA: NADH-quinone oxidoreductase subunit C [Lacunisphaera sp.]|nr:NADH-quinone oxidoreductase subunit C [Lacunisphaera sp.]
MNAGPAAEHSLLVDAAHAREIATFLRDDEALRLDYCSNATGIDWPDKEVVDPATKAKTVQPGCLEAVYHLYSISRKQGPVILRVRTANRSDQVTLPSLTPVWKSCEFQEREIFDLYGVVFEGHPDLRRLLMWDGFKDYPMRRDYVAPDDFEWEPTPHGNVLERAKAHWPAAPVAGVADPGASAAAGAGTGPGSTTPPTKTPEAKP